MMAVLPCSTSPPTAVTIVSVQWSETVPISVYHAESMFSGFKLSSSIAFTVELSQNQYVFDGGRIMCDRVLTNTGGYYDDINGFFKCPDDDIYVFGVSVYTTDATTPWSVSRIMKNKDIIVQGPISYIATDTYDGGSSAIAVLLQCTNGHSIYVETQSAHNFSHNSYAPGLTSFTGYKLYGASQDAIAFTAIMTNNHTATSDDQPFLFDLVITNIGDAFDPTFSVFTCPDNDYYFFSWSVTANFGGANSGVDLFIDDTRTRRCHLTEQSTDDDSETSGTCFTSHIMKCSLGSRVQVSSRHVVEGRIFLGGYTMFAGHKIPGAWSG